MLYSKVRVGVGAEEAAGAGQYPVLFGSSSAPSKNSATGGYSNPDFINFLSPGL